MSLRERAFSRATPTKEPLEKEFVCHNCRTRWDGPNAPDYCPHCGAGGNAVEEDSPGVQGPPLSTHGHQFGKPCDDGYATCRMCGCREDSSIAAKMCIRIRAEAIPLSDSVRDPRQRCPECGPNVRVNEDGCCANCGAEMILPAALPPTEPATGRSEWRLLDSAREVDNYLVRGDRVLMSDGHMVCMGHLAKYPDGVLRGSVDFGNGMPQDWGITHWMPLPELPAAPVSPATKDGQEQP